MHDLKTQFDRVVSTYENLFLSAPIVNGAKWQSIKAPASMVEVFNQSFTLDLKGVEDLNLIAHSIQPNLPWADRHFEEERVSGQPINPGETWKIWPYGLSAENHLKNGQYDHSYAERYWPKKAGVTSNGRTDDASPFNDTKGIRHNYGDLDDIVDILISDPLTRQAYLPIFYPEDVIAARLSKRIPCTLGYQFIRRNDQMHIIYPMRSCDFVRHFKDDVYLTIRLLVWVLDQCIARDPENWSNVSTGTFRMHITSLHMFEPDRQALTYRMKAKNG